MIRLQKQAIPESTYLIVSQLITQIVDKAIMVTLIWYITQQYSQFELSIFLGVIMLPYFINLPFLHTLTDRFSAVTIVRFTEISRAACFIMAFIFFKGQLSFASIMVIGFFKNTATSLFDPVMLSIPPRLTRSESTHQLMSWMNAGFAIGVIIGPMLAMAVIHFHGINTLFLLAAIFYAISFLLLRNIRLIETFSHEKNTIQSDHIFQKLRKIMKESTGNIGAFILYSALMNLLFGPLSLLIPLLVSHMHHGGFSHYSGLQIAMGAGAVTGSLLSGAVRIRRIEYAGIYGLFCYLLSACCYIVLGCQHQYGESVLSLFCLDLCMSAGNVFIMTHYQKQSMDTLLPTVMSCVVFISVALSPLAMCIAGILLHYCDVQTLLVSYAVSAVILSTAIILYVSKNVTIQVNEKMRLV